MKTIPNFLALFFLIISAGNVMAQKFSFDFYDGTFNSEFDESSDIGLHGGLSVQSVEDFYNKLDHSNYGPLLKSLLAYKEKHQLNDWIYYQLIRRTVQQISPKADNYHRYTLYKWFFLSKSGYDARVGVGNKRIIFYVRNNENINDIPFFMEDGHKYMCLNYHDYGYIDFAEEKVIPARIAIPEARSAFSYKVTRMPDFKPETYTQKDINFKYKQRSYHFQVKLNPEIERIFANYPGVDFETYFNIPLSKETYGSLIPVLKRNLRGMGQKKGVDYLMRFTRYSFLYQDDKEFFGKEKRLSPEQTLISAYSDCDDRAALFFYLVREIYDLPMIALLYPSHITMAVQFAKPSGKPVIYKGEKYTVCEATPQSEDLRMGQISPGFHNASYEVVYQYTPAR